MAKRGNEKVTFTEKEVSFLKGSRLARIATVSPAGQPHVVPVGFEFDGEYFYVGGYNLTRSLKFKNIQQNKKVALVVDDLVSTDPWTPRFLLIRGTAEIVKETGAKEDEVYIKIRPIVKRSSGTLG